jgi:hypothetical protein
MARPALAEFKELGSGAKPGTSVIDLRKHMYRELKSLESTEAGRVTAGQRIVVQLYFPDRISEDNIFIAEIKVEEKLDRQTEQLDAKIAMKNYFCKHDTREPPVFFSTEDYESAASNGELKSGFEMFRVLGRRLLYYVHEDVKLQ